MNRFLLPLILALFIFAPLSIPRSCSAQLYIIDPQHSQIGFRVKHMGIGWVDGKFAEFSGSIDFNPQDITKSHVDAIIQASSLDTGSAKRDKHLRSEDFFNSMKMRSIRFVSGKIEGSSPENFKMTGVLTIKDVAKEVTLDVTYGGSLVDPWGSPRAAFRATTVIHRKDFGLTWNRVLDSGGFLVGEDVDVALDIQGVSPANNAPKMSNPAQNKAKP